MPDSSTSGAEGHPENPEGDDPSELVSRQPPPTISDVDGLVQTAQGVSMAREESPAARRDTAAADDAELDVNLKRTVARLALRVMAAQILIADAVFILWGSVNGWDIEANAITAWLGATVVEVIGIVFVMTSYLFPKRTKG